MISAVSANALESACFVSLTSPATLLPASRRTTHYRLTHSTIYTPIMFSVSVTTILKTLLLATPVFSANATEWGSRSIYQVTRWRIRTCPCLMEPRSLLQTGSLHQMTRRCLATRVNASIAVAHGRESQITSTISKAWDSTPYGFRPFLPI